ncbi:hypothetical protein [Coleofasciculus sp. B1-GNL1-01]|uniref:hypothetical protein n=1 Tax=Coleofasciculus sp. B1-GNL1-01 TaxID=3068484 RepID=UPI0040630474
MQRLYNGAERPNRCVYCYNNPPASYLLPLTKKALHPIPAMTRLSFPVGTG